MGARRPVDRLRDLDHHRRPHQARAGGGRRRADAHRARGLLPRPGLHPRRIAGRISGRGSVRPALRHPARHAAAERAARRRGRDRRHRAAQRHRDPLDACRRRGADAGGVGARRPRPAVCRHRQLAGLFHDQPRAADDHHGRPRSPHAAARPGRRSGQQPAQRRRHRARARWPAGIRQPAEQALPRRRAAGRPRDGGGTHPGPGREHGGAGEADVARGRRVSRLDPRRPHRHLGVGRAVLPPGRGCRRAAEDRRRRRSAAVPAVGLDPAERRAGHHHGRRPGDRERRRPGHRQPDRRRRRAGPGRGAGRRTPPRPARQDGDAGLRGRPRAHVGTARAAPDGDLAGTTPTWPTA